MRHDILKTAAAIALAALTLASCKETWLMYDLGQKDKLYFMEKNQIHTYSFTFMDTDEIDISTNVNVMGDISENDRTFKVEQVPVEQGDSLLGYPLVTGVEGEDYELGNLVIPAGKTSGTLDIKLKRTAKMLDSCYVRIALRLCQDDEFDVATVDSTANDAIVSPVFYCYVNDGEPSCPSWWYNAKAGKGWNMYWGNFTPMKFRKMLALLHDTKETSPKFYEYCVESFGEYLDAEPDKDKNNNMNNFWISCSYQTAWTKYVRIPLYDYFVEYYKEHPDDPDFEQMGDEYVNLKSYTGWGNPHSGKYAGIN